MAVVRPASTKELSEGSKKGNKEQESLRFLEEVRKKRDCRDIARKGDPERREELKKREEKGDPDAELEPTSIGGESTKKKAKG